MRVTVIVNDGAVYVGDQCKINLNLSGCGIPAAVRALQWNGTRGEIEYYANEDGTRPHNDPITELPAWVDACIEVFNNTADPIPQRPDPSTFPPVGQ